MSDTTTHFSTERRAAILRGPQAHDEDGMPTQTTRTRDRIGRVDIAIALVLSALGIVLMASNVYDTSADAPGDVSFLAIPTILAFTATLLWRSVEPVRALLAAVVVLGLHAAAFGLLVRCGVAFPVLGFLAFAAGARLDGREAQLGLLLGLAAAVLVGATDFLGIGVSTVGVPLVAVCWGLGRVAHSRGRLATQLRARNAELQHTRDERARLEVTTDRARLSGELDELLHRRLHDLAELADRGPGSVADGSAVTLLVDIERESRATLDEMRALVGVLRSDEDRTALAPQPSLTSLDALLVRTRGDGARLTSDGDARALPAGVELTAYRVVEQLLEALDDAPGVRVHVHFAADALELTVEGPVGRRGDVTAALDRARERVELHRGSLRTTTQGGRAAAVAALPLRAGT